MGCITVYIVSIIILHHTRICICICIIYIHTMWHMYMILILIINISLLMIKPAYCNSLFSPRYFFTMIWNQSVRSRIPIVGLVLGFKRSWQNLAEGVCSHSGGVHPNPLGFAKFGNFTNFSKYSPNILPNSGECWNIVWFFPIISRNTSISQSLLCMSLPVYHKTPWAAEELQLFSPCCSARGKSWSWK